MKIWYQPVNKIDVEFSLQVDDGECIIPIGVVRNNATGSFLRKMRKKFLVETPKAFDKILGDIASGEIQFEGGIDEEN